MDGVEDRDEAKVRVEEEFRRKRIAKAVELSEEGRDIFDEIVASTYDKSVPATRGRRMHTVASIVTRIAPTRYGASDSGTDHTKFTTIPR